MNPENNQQTTEVRETTTTDPAQQEAPQSVTRSDSVPGSVLAARIVYFIGGIILSLLALRFILALLGANRLNPFADFIFGTSYPFVAPFFGLFGAEPAYGQSVLELSTLVAMIFYALVIAGIAKALTLGRRNPDAV